MAEVDAGKLEYSVQDGQMYVEARVKVERTTGAANIGFNDDTGEGSNSLPMELSGTTWTSNAGTWIGFVWDSDATNDTWHVMWVDDDADSSTAIGTLNSGITVASGVWYTLRVHLFDQGSGKQSRATFSVSDGTNAWEYETSGTIDRDVNMTWHLGVENRTSTGCFMDVDYIEAGRSRQNTAP
jgi:hypothetical protein